jgi:hypothetical protein
MGAAGERHGGDGLSDADVAALFEQIVAGWDTDAEPGAGDHGAPGFGRAEPAPSGSVHPGGSAGALPDTEQDDPPRPPSADGGPERAGPVPGRPNGTGPPGFGRALLDGTAAFGGLPGDPLGLDPWAADPDDHFVPPDPPPLPRPRLGFVAAIALLLAGLVMLISPSLLGLSDAYCTPLGLTTMIVGGVVLVFLLRPGTSEADEEDDGSRL